MIVLLLFSIIALILTYLSSKDQVKSGFKWGMFIITFIAAIHYNYGSDYESYFNWYQSFISGDYSLADVLQGAGGALGQDTDKEYGWRLLYWLVKPLGESGFYVLVALISIFQGVVVYQLIKKYVPKKWMVFALFVYLFDTTLYVGSFSGMRQHLAMAIIGCALPFILDKKIIIASILVLLSTTIHQSAFIFLPFVIILGFFPIKNTRTVCVIYISILIALIASDLLVGDLIARLFSMDVFEDYEHYAEISGQSYGLGFLLSLIPIFVTLYYMLQNPKDNTNSTIVSLSAITIVALPITLSVSMSFRLMYYFQFFNIISYPVVFGSIKNKILRNGLIFLVAFYYLFNYYTFFHTVIRYDSTYIYHSLFELFKY